MDSGTKMFLAFLGGAAVGAAGIAYLNRNKMNFEYMKPAATRILSKGMNMKDAVVRKMAAMKEDVEDMAAEARDQADAMQAREKSGAAAQAKTAG